MKYASAAAFRRALSDHAPDGSKDRWLKLVAFERFLARLFAGAETRWVLKGGYALELRLGNRARTTLDLDLSVPPPPFADLLESVQDAAERDLGDYFDYRVHRQLELRQAPEGGERFLVEAWLGGKELARFHLDVGQGDAHDAPADRLNGQTDLRFAGLESPTFPCYSLRHHFAEKLHAYSRPRARRTRVKDLVDLALLLGLGVRPDQQTASVIVEVFQRYGTHALSQSLPEPPEDWLEPFRALAHDLDLASGDARFWHEHLERFLNELLAAT